MPALSAPLRSRQPGHGPRTTTSTQPRSRSASPEHCPPQPARCPRLSQGQPGQEEPAPRSQKQTGH
eukprot:7614224-Lingulodinium_polyedra.AAC.1